MAVSICKNFILWLLSLCKSAATRSDAPQLSLHEIVLPLLFITGLLSQLACSSTHKDKTPEVKKPKIVQLTQLSFFSVADNACQLQPLEMALTDLTVGSVSNGQSTEVALSDIKGISSTLSSLSSRIVSETWYGLKFSRSCEIDDEACYASSSTSTWTFDKESGKLLKICRNGYDYPNDSYEQVALNATYYLDQAYQYYQQAMGKDATTKAQLLVFPLFTITVNDAKTNRQGVLVKADNLAYWPDQNAFLVFPLSSAQSSQSKLWDSAFVLAHEFGHFVETQVMNHHAGLTSLGNLKWDAFSHRYVSANNSKMLSKFEVDAGRSQTLIAAGPTAASDNNNAGQFLSAVSEGFADLIAYFTVEGDVGSLLNVDDLGNKRNPAVDRFDEGLGKRMTDKMLERLFEDNVMPSEFNANVEFNDNHISGAVMAHIVAATAAEYVKYLQQQNLLSKEQQMPLSYRLAISWYVNLWQLMVAETPTNLAQYKNHFITSLLQGVKSNLVNERIALDAEQLSILGKSLCAIVIDRIPANEGCVF